jgi:hypothetical protein
MPLLPMTFPSANRASRAAWRARRLALLTLSSSVLVRDLLFSNFNSAAFSLDCTSMALSESHFLIRCESEGESKIAWPDVDFSYFVDYSRAYSWRLECFARNNSVNDNAS